MINRLTRRAVAVSAIGTFALFGCSGGPSNPGNTSASAATPSATGQTIAAASGATPVYTFTVVKTYPHDPTSFTEGLFLSNGMLYESTGLNGQSTLRQNDLTTGKATKKITIADTYFGEGITDWNGKIYQLTWKNEVGFLYDDTTLKQTGKFSYTGEGWALTHDTKSIIMDDGSDAITFRDPATFAVQRTIHVADHGTPVTQLNELEYIKGEIFANVWQTNYIVRIDPQTGNVNSWIDLTGIQPSDGNTDDVLNGIAYDSVNDKIYVTGKRWPSLFQITLQLKPQ